MFIKHKQNEKFNEISREKMLLATGNLVPGYMYATWAICDTRVTFPVLSLVLNMV